MAARLTDLPDGVPVLSRGKHRSPRKGGCFMEFASFLAGEQWSDHPKCTHPLLATLARDVNDYVSEDGRRRIAPLVPSVVDVVSDDPLVELAIAVYAASAALPIAAYERQPALAVGLIRSDQELAKLSGGDVERLRAIARAAMDQSPHETEMARRFVDRPWGRTHKFGRAAPHIVHLSVTGIARACIPDPEDRLCTLLEETIAECRGLVLSPQARPEQLRLPVRPAP